MNIESTIKRSCWLAALHYGGPVYLLTQQDRRTIENDYARTIDIASLPIQSFKTASRDSYWSYYGGRPEFSIVLAQKLFEALNNGATIDWDKTQPVKDDTETAFNGTYGDDTNVPIVTGTLVLNDGQQFPWIANLNTNLTGMKDVLEFIYKWENKSDEEIIENLKNKLDIARKNKNNMNYVLSEFDKYCKYNYD